MKFNFFFYKTALHIAVEKGTREIVQLLLIRKEIDIDALDEIFFVTFL